MNRKRVDFEKYEVLESDAKFYKGTDTSEGYYHVCDGFLPDGPYRLEFMPEIYKHDINVNICFSAGGYNIMQPIKFCPLCGKKLSY